MSKTTNHWLKKIFNATTVSIMVGLIGTCAAIIQCEKSNGGKFVAFVNSREATPPIDRHVYIYMDSDSADLSRIGLFPQITNPSKYPLEDVLVTYQIDSHSANVAYTDYFAVHRVAHGQQATNIDKTLYAKTDMPEPFFYFIMHDGDQASIRIKATYKGVDEPFSYTATVSSRKILAPTNDAFVSRAFEAAHNDAVQQRLDCVDVFLLHGGNVMVCQDKPVRELVIHGKAVDSETPPSAERPAAAVGSPAESPKTLTQIEKEQDELVQKAKDEAGTPWYMYIVVAILFLVGLIAVLVCMFTVMSLSDDGFGDGWLSACLILFIVPAVIFYCYYYTLDILDSPNKIDRMWAGLATTYLTTLSALIAGYVSGLVKRTLLKNVKDEDRDWQLLVIAVVFIPLFLLSIMLTKSIPV